MKLTVITLISLVSISVFAKSKEVMGVLVNCDCSESTIDGQRYLQKVQNKKTTRSDQNALNQAYSACSKLATNSLAITVTNCQYIKVVDEKIGQNKYKRRVERIVDDAENSLHQDLLSTL